MSKRQERAVRTREVVLRAAAETFERDGVNATSLAWISEVAEVSKGALYFHFDSKDELAEAVCAEGHGRMSSLVRDCCRTGAPALEKLAKLCRDLVRAVRGDVVVRAALSLVRERGVPRALHVDPYRNWCRLVHRLLSRARAEGGLGGGVDVDTSTALLVSAAMGVEVLSRRDPSWLDEELLGRVWETVFPAPLS